VEVVLKSKCFCILR